ncbi:MAG: serine hydrolase [Pseudomonadota bacterium]
MQLIHGPSLQPTVETDSLATSLGDARADFMTPLGSSMAAMDAAGATSVIVIQDGRVLAEWGDTGRVSSVHSVRKSIVGILYGIAEARGLIDVSKTMAELGVDEQQTPLTVAEKSATLHDLLTSRSGIYHPSVNDDGAAAPRRGSHAPDAHFYYNNWSFNALGGIFEQETGLSLNEAFRDWIAGPTGMQDVDEHTVRYDFDHASSVFPAYRFWLSGRDMARFGLLVLNDGVWEGQQIIPREWLQRSFMAYSENVRGEGVGYGYLWWLMPGGVIMATGTGGQKLWLDPDRKLLIATRVDTGDGFSRGVWWQFGVRVHNGHLRALHQDMIRVLEQDS